jgi:hypothetical protein
LSLPISVQKPLTALCRPGVIHRDPAGGLQTGAQHVARFGMESILPAPITDPSAKALICLCQPPDPAQVGLANVVAGLPGHVSNYVLVAITAIPTIVGGNPVAPVGCMSRIARHRDASAFG